MVTTAFTRQDLASAGQPPPRYRLELTAIDASLCARRYGAFGLGNRSLLSGRAEFRFEWAGLGDLVARTEIVRVDVPKDKGRPPEDILAEGLSMLAALIRARREAEPNP